MDYNSMNRTNGLIDKHIAVKKLNDALEKLSFEDDAYDFLFLLHQITKIQGGMSVLSKRTNINRQNLYRTFAETGNPKFKSLSAILRSLGFKLTVEPLSREQMAKLNENTSSKKSEPQSSEEREQYYDNEVVTANE